MKKSLIILIILLGVIKVNAQRQPLLLDLLFQPPHHHPSNQEVDEGFQENYGRNKFAIFGGSTCVDVYENNTEDREVEKWIPTLGFEYYYTLNSVLDIGLLGDVELDDYYVMKNDEYEHINNAVVVACVFRLKTLQGFGFFIGPGIETEFMEDTSESSFVFKTGVDLELEIGDGWELTPVASYDIKENCSYSVGISVGKRF